MIHPRSNSEYLLRLESGGTESKNRIKIIYTSSLNGMLYQIITGEMKRNIREKIGAELSVPYFTSKRNYC